MLTWNLYYCKSVYILFWYLVIKNLVPCLPSAPVDPHCDEWSGGTFIFDRTTKEKHDMVPPKEYN